MDIKNLNTRKKLQVAEGFYEEKLKKNPDDVEAHNNLGVILFQLGKFQEAKSSYQKAIQINPKYINAHNNLAVIFKLSGNLHKALDSCQKSIKINPNNLTAYNNLAAVFYEMGELKKSISCYKKIIQIQPNNATTYNNLGIAYYEFGEIQKAENCYNKVIQINPNHINAYYNLGEIYRDAKDFKKASDYFKKVDTQLGNAQFLECIYFSDGLKKYNELLKKFVEKDPVNLRIAALASYVSKKENINNIYPFCKNPLDYFFSINLKNELKFSVKFSNNLLKISEKLGSKWRLKPIVKNGYQSTGNLFDSSYLEIVDLKKKIEKQIITYREKYKNSKDYYISRWPSKTNLFGWYIKLKKQGQVKSHIHEDGWLSAVFYLKIPKPLKKNEGSINLSIQGLDYPYDKNLPNFYYAPKPFDLILYPSSLFHYTVPFTSNEERHCIAFDLKPKMKVFG